MGTGLAISRRHTACASVRLHVASIETARVGCGNRTLVGVGRSRGQNIIQKPRVTALAVQSGVANPQRRPLRLHLRRDRATQLLAATSSMESMSTTAIAIVAGSAFSRGRTARASVLWHVSSIEIAKAGFGSQILAGVGKNLKQKDIPNHIPTALVARSGVVVR